MKLLRDCSIRRKLMFVIVITSLHRDFLPSAWGMYSPTIWDWATFVGTIGLFLAQPLLLEALLVHLVRDC